MMIKVPAPSTDLVLVEFAGLGAAQTFAAVFPGRLAPEITTLDPLDYVDPSGPTDLLSLAAALASAVVDELGVTGPRVMLAAACSASALLAPLAAELQQRHLTIVRSLAVDPRVVDQGFVRDELAALLGRLGGANPVAPAPPAAWSGPLTSAGMAANLNRAATCYVTDELEDEDERDIFLTEVLPRSQAWLNLLLAMARPADQLGSSFEVHAILREDADSDRPALFGPGVRVQEHRLPAGDKPVLIDSDAAVLIRDLWKDAR